MKKLLVAVVAVSMLICALGLTAFADGNEAQIGSVPYGTVEEALAAADSGSTIELLTNAQIEKRLTIKKAITIDGNGNTIAVKGDSRCIDIVNDAGDATVTIKNLTVTEDASNGLFERGINYNATGVLNLENVYVEGLPTYALNLPGKADNAVVNITNCNLKGFAALNIWGTAATINVEDSILHAHNTIEKTGVDAANTSAVIYLNSEVGNIADDTVVTITGGKIIASRATETCYGVHIVMNSTTTGRVDISDTTEITKIDESQPTERQGVAKIGDAIILSLEGAFDYANNGDTILLIRDIEFTAGDVAAGRPQDAISYSDNKSFTLDLNGHTISSKGLGEDVDANSIIRINTSVNADANKPQTITIKNGTIDTQNFYKCIVATGNTNGKLTVNLENVTLKSDKNNSSAAEVWYDATLNIKNVTIESKLGGNVYANEGGIANIYSGTFTQKQAATTNSHMSTCVSVGYDGVVNVYGGTFNSDLYGAYLFPSGGEINIYGGTFKAPTAVRADAPVVNIEGGTFSGAIFASGTNADINISGGTFDAAVDEKHFADGFEAVKNADGVYEIDKETEVPATATAAKQADGKAAVAINAAFDNYETIETKSFGVYIYKAGTKLGKKVFLDANNGSLAEAEGLFNVVIKDIPESEYETVLVCVPFVVDSSDVISLGNAKAVKASQLLGIN